jgi:Lrp/AsnC family transcriptional regulator, leucine-responsive regulatory protein
LPSGRIVATPPACLNGESKDMTATEPTNRRKISTIPLDRALLDPINCRLIEELRTDARVGLAELGRRVGLSAPSVSERIQRLEEAGVITGYRAVIDPRAIGYPIAAVVRIRPASQQLKKIPEAAAKIPEVVECHRITGEDCYLIKVHLRSMDDLEGILDRIAIFGQTTTSIVHSSPIEDRALPLNSSE